MELGIRGRAVLVTASSKGIGKAIAESFASEGCRVAICSRNKEDLIVTSDEIKRRYDNEVFWCVCDLNKAKDIENTVNAVVRNFGSIDILVNNCGGPIAGSFRELNEKDWEVSFEQVLMSTVRFCNLVIPDMILKEWGRIVNITSVSVKQPIDNLVLSNSLRSGVIGLAKSLSNELAQYNITVNNVAPGYTLTNRLYDLAVGRAKKSGLSHEEELSEIAKKIPMQRLGRPEEIASLVTYLSSMHASYITGNTIQVDGGSVKSIL